MKTFNVALIGLGNIGLEVYKNLLQNKKIILKKTGFKINILKVAAKNISKKRGNIRIPNRLWEKNPLKLTKDKTGRKLIPQMPISPLGKKLFNIV